MDCDSMQMAITEEHQLSVRIKYNSVHNWLLRRIFLSITITYEINTYEMIYLRILKAIRKKLQRT